MNSLDERNTEYITKDVTTDRVLELTDNEILDIPIVELLKRKLLSVRACNCLKRMGVKNLRDLSSKPRPHAGQTYNFGKKTCNELVLFAQSKGVKFSD